VEVHGAGGGAGGSVQRQVRRVQPGADLLGDGGGIEAVRRSAEPFGRITRTGHDGIQPPGTHQRRRELESDTGTGVASHGTGTIHRTTDPRHVANATGQDHSTGTISSIPAIQTTMNLA